MADPEPGLTPEQLEGLEMGELIPSESAFYIYTKGPDKKVYMMIDQVEWDLPAGIEEMAKALEERDKLRAEVQKWVSLHADALVVAARELHARKATELQGGEIRKSLREVIESWYEAWDCSAHPGHGPIQDAVEKANLMLLKTNARGEL